jgi:cytochrome P450
MTRVPAGALSPEEFMEVQKVVFAYRQGADELKENGTFPEMSFWDMLLATKHKSLSPSVEQISSMIEDSAEKGNLLALEKMPGPWQEAHTMEDKVALIQQVTKAVVEGYDIDLHTEFQLKYGDRGLGSNIAVPRIQTMGSGLNASFEVVARILVADPSDAERVARTHLRKEGNFEHVLYDGIISTTDNEHWQAQRRHLAEVFLPLSSLAKIMPTSLDRAKKCTDRLIAATANGEPADMSDFLLHEAQAQLQLALLGTPESMMDATNEDIRASFMNDLGRGKLGALGTAMKTLMAHAAEDPSLALPSDAGPVCGPLSRACAMSGLSASTNYGNMLLILFAGHDTTGHTMTWLLLELARHPEMQRQLQRDIDAFFEELDGRDPTYRDLSSKHLDFLDRCITETLRLWPAVANGTFRQLQFADTVAGAGGARMEMPKGTFVQVVNWPRHRNPELWGADVNEFNPRREFHPREMSRVASPMAATTPQSARFSPFAHNPRSCLGRNFAQMEMRLIIAYLLHRCDFSLAPPYDSLYGQESKTVSGVNEFRGVNRATFGPIDIENLNSAKSSPFAYWYTYALKMNVCLRSR